MRAMRRAVLTVLLTLGLAAPASATLRSPHLGSGCEAGFTYGEITRGQWIVEGCNKQGEAKGDETTRTLFKGPVELNGMLVKGSKNLVASTGTARNQVGDDVRFFRIERDDGKLVLDPRIGGERRDFVIYTGDIEFEHRSEGSKGQTTSPVEQDIPIGSDATILGMRLGGRIRDAKVSNSTDGGSIKLKPRMRMGETASALLRDFEAKVDVETVDGTGMKITGLEFRIPDIAIAGIGGFRDLHVTYSEAQDEWSGGVDVDLGDIFPGIAFDMSISASTGAPTAIELDVSPLNIALGPTGIFLQGLRGGFDTNPLILNSGITLTAGPQVAGLSVVEINGDTRIQLEPVFRMENTGNARLLPVGSTQVARGDGHLILDSRGYLSIGADARFEASLLDVGIAAQIEGDGDYSTVDDRFNIEAEATGSLLLGPLGQADIVKYAALVSSDGWGTCGNVFLFVKAGVGQDWDGNVKLLLGCDLSPFEVRVPDPGARQAGDRVQTFTVRRGTKQVAVEITADGPEPRVGLFREGTAVAATVPAERFRAVGDDTVVIAPPGSATQYLFLRSPPPGRYALRWAADGAQVTGVRYARDLVPLSARVKVARVRSRPGLRRLLVSRVRGLATGERLELGVRTATGIMPVGDSFDELSPGTHEIVGTVVRDGIPLPGRTAVLGRYRAKLPPPPAKLTVRKRGRRLKLLARARRHAETPQAWLYVLRSGGRVFAVRRARPGRIVSIPIEYPNIVATVRPIVAGRILPGKALVKRVS